MKNTSAQKSTSQILLICRLVHRELDTIHLCLLKFWLHVQNDIGAIDLVYDKFVAEFPLCYAFWVKYGTHKSRLCGPNEVVQVYERAVQAVPFSVDLWCYYCTFGTLAFEDLSDVRR